MAEAERERGRAEARQTDILSALAIRLRVDVSPEVDAAVRTVIDPQRLEQLFARAVQVDSLEDFQAGLREGEPL